MSGWLTLRIPGAGNVRVNMQDAQLERLQAQTGDVLEAEQITASRQGLEMLLAGWTFTYVPTTVLSGARNWFDFWDEIVRDMFAGRQPQFKVSLSGTMVALVQDRWAAERRRERRGRGRPRRNQRWDADREELYARILQRRQQHGEPLRDAIWSTARIEPDRFRRAFGGEATERRIEAAAQYFKRHARDAPAE